MSARGGRRQVPIREGLSGPRRFTVAEIRHREGRGLSRPGGGKDLLASGATGLARIAAGAWPAPSPC